MTLTDFTLHISLTFTKFLYNKFIPLSYPEIIVNPLLLFAPLFMSFVMTLDNNDYLSRCSKLIAYMNLIKKVMLSNASTPSFGPYAQLSSVV